MENSSTTTSLLTPPQLAAALQVSRRTIGNWTASRRIPCLRLGRRCVRYDLDRVLEALARYEREEVR